MESNSHCVLIEGKCNLGQSTTTCTMSCRLYFQQAIFIYFLLVHYVFLVLIHYYFFIFLHNGKSFSGYRFKSPSNNTRLSRNVDPAGSHLLHTFLLHSHQTHYLLEVLLPSSAPYSVSLFKRFIHYLFSRYYSIIIRISPRLVIKRSYVMPGTFSSRI